MGVEHTCIIVSTNNWDMETALVIATIILAGVTAWLVIETRLGSKRQLGVQVWLTLVKRVSAPVVWTQDKG